MQRFMQQKKSGIHQTFKWVMLSIALLVLCCCIVLVFIAKNKQPDIDGLNRLSAFATQPMTNTMKAISFLGNHLFLIPANLLLILFFIGQKNKTAAMQVLFIALSSLGLVTLLKNIFHRARPEFPLVEGVTNYSFPSGHAMMSLAFWGLLLYFIYQKSKQVYSKLFITVTIIVLLIAIGWSRIYLRLHYPTDVLAGWSIEFIWLFLSLTFLHRIANKKTTSYT